MDIVWPKNPAEKVYVFLAKRFGKYHKVVETVNSGHRIVNAIRVEANGKKMFGLQFGPSVKHEGFTAIMFAEITYPEKPTEKELEKRLKEIEMPDEKLKKGEEQFTGKTFELETIEEIHQLYITKMVEALMKLPD